MGALSYPARGVHLDIKNRSTIIPLSSVWYSSHTLLVQLEHHNYICSVDRQTYYYSTFLYSTMVQIKLVAAFILAAISVAPVVALPRRIYTDANQVQVTAEPRRTTAMMTIPASQIPPPTQNIQHSPSPDPEFDAAHYPTPAPAYTPPPDYHHEPTIKSEPETPRTPPPNYFSNSPSPHPQSPPPEVPPQPPKIKSESAPPAELKSPSRKSKSPQPPNSNDLRRSERLKTKRRVDYNEKKERKTK